MVLSSRLELSYTQVCLNLKKQSLLHFNELVIGLSSKSDWHVAPTSNWHVVFKSDCIMIQDTLSTAKFGKKKKKSCASLVRGKSTLWSTNLLEHEGSLLALMISFVFHNLYSLLSLINEMI